MSIDNQVEAKIRKYKAGAIFFSEDFYDLGNPGAVKVALHRLVKRGDLSKIA